MAREPKAKGKTYVRPRRLTDADRTNGQPFVPTDEQRHMVALLASTGWTNERIALVVINKLTGLPIDEHCLAANFHHELTTGAADVKTRVVSALYTAATKWLEPDKDGNLRTLTGPEAAILQLWAKSKLGWVETKRLELSGENGGDIVVTHKRRDYSELDVSDLAKLYAERTAAGAVKAPD